MAPRTRSSQTGALNVNMHAAPNENQVPFQVPSHMGTSNLGRTGGTNRNTVYQDVPVPGKSNPLWE